MSALNSASGNAEEGLLLPGWYLDVDDYTYYVSRNTATTIVDLSSHVSKYEILLGDPAFSTDKYSASSGGGVHCPDNPVPKLESCNSCRLLICKAYAGEEIAVTARRLAKPQHPGSFEKRKDPESWEVGATGFVKAPDSADVPFPVPISAVCEELDKLFLNTPKPSGLILVSGATNSAKSELTRGLIARLIKRQVDVKGERWPHLVTYEDPIEKRFFPDSKTALTHGVEYTPRQKGVDVGSLESAFNDALRQTPSVFYVGEVREDADWKELMRFAGTGHLIVATAHAGSLVEAMERVFRGMQAKTAADRGQIAARVLAVIHQRKFDLSDDLRKKLHSPKFEFELSDDQRTRLMSPKFEFELSDRFQFDVLLPTIWRRTSAGVAALVGDGLGSVLPNRPGVHQSQGGPSSLGRQYFAAALRNPNAWQDLFIVDLLGTMLEKRLRADIGKLDSEAQKVWSSAAGGDRKQWKACVSLAYLIVRLWRDVLRTAGTTRGRNAAFKEVASRLRDNGPGLDGSSKVTHSIWKGLAAAKVRFERPDIPGESAHNADVVDWLRLIMLAVAEDRPQMEKLAATAELAEEQGAWALFQAEAIRLDLMGE